ncbi:MAG TPA: prepilin-type N-terminal cleavage/methylation domain-containing protein [Polyangiales bacterium]|nr:prepilin-type N-terminal cleavage/methylation domain-containing protein [Polyangiales bacterium]
MIRAQRGFTLIELMISMVLGLVVIGAVLSVMLANKRTYRTSTAMSEVQESARSAFELMARDIRQSGATGCDNSGKVANVLNAGALWWQPWFVIKGFDGTDADPAVAAGTNPGDRITGTDSLELQSIAGTGLAVKSHDTANAKITINAATTDFATGSVLMVCDFDHAVIFQASGYDTTNVAVVHGDGTGAPGNCSKGLGFPTDCGTATGNAYKFGANSQIAHFSATDWYIGNNGRPDEGGRSLYRQRLTGSGALVTEEIVAGVTDMQIRYRINGSDSFADASTLAAADWPNVNALTVTFTLNSADQRASTDDTVNSGRLQRSFTSLVTLRNRVP